jgi:phosphatidylglycerol---prolipoprotein diacylglyceryl transferase
MRSSPTGLARSDLTFSHQNGARRRPNQVIVAAMSGTALHAIFDVLAWLAAGAAAWALSKLRQLQFPTQSYQPAYLAALVFGAALGAYLFGTLNLRLSGLPGIARSVEGALVGGTVAIEVYKWCNGISLRTGARFALPLAIGIAIGRIGCFLAGLDDFTYGSPTTLPFGHDFGDGIARHPVQLYEAAAMAGFAVFYVIAVFRRNRFVLCNGFYLALGYYGLQRFAWEFLKPYGLVFSSLTLFHLLSLIIFFYAVLMLATAPIARSSHERAVA